jgi:hypothetical protein
MSFHGSLTPSRAGLRWRGSDRDQDLTTEGQSLVESLQTFMASEAFCETDFFGVSG